MELLHSFRKYRLWAQNSFLIYFLLVWLSSLKLIHFSFPFLSRFIWAHFDHLWLSDHPMLSYRYQSFWSRFQGKYIFMNFLALWKSVWTHLSPGVNIIILIRVPFIFAPLLFLFLIFMKCQCLCLGPMWLPSGSLINMRLGCLFSYMLGKTVRIWEGESWDPLK